MLKINEIIEKHYNDFELMLPDKEIVHYDGYTIEDIFHNVLVTALRKFKNKNIDEDIGYEYIKKTLLTEILFLKKKKGSDRLVYEEDMSAKKDTFSKNSDL